MLITPKAPKLDSLLIAISFLASGIVIFNVSVIFNSQIVSFIGLGLTFWGALFLLITPQRQVEASFLVTSTLPVYMTIDRLLNDFEPKNEAYNIASHIRNVYLPKRLYSVTEMITFIPAKQITEMAEIDAIRKGNFINKSQKGLLITPPGVGILDRIEDKHNIDLTKIPFGELDETLPHLLKELYLSKEIKMATNGNGITLQINESLYKKLYSQENDLKSIKLLGCPLVSAAACAIAKSTGKPVMIQEINTSSDAKTTTAILKIVQM